MLVSHSNTPLTAVGITRYHRPDEAYVKLRNDFARNAQISLRAFRVASFILSHQDGFAQSQQQIARACGLSLNTVRAALEDLRRDHYLVSRRIREHGRWIGTAYAVSDIPFTAEELNALSEPHADSEHADSEHAESAQPKKISSSKKINNPEETNPSGGTTAEAARPSLESPPPEESQEEPMSPPTDAIALFDVPAPVKAGKAESPSARTVVAAFVDSYRRHHSGADPVKRSISRVGRDAKATLEAGTASPEELAAAASRMGEGPYDNLAVALNIHRQKGQKRKGFTAGTPARLHTHPEQQAAAARVETEEYQQLLTDDELVRWVARDSAEVSKWIARYPDLEARFRDVA